MVAATVAHCRLHISALSPKAEYRQEVVRVALASGLSRKQVASGFGIWLSSLTRWIKGERSTVSMPEPQIDLIHENERRRKEVRMLREEREILKKATQFLAKQKP